MKIGFLVNPIAGMGGAVGLKGTDGAGREAEAAALGAEKNSPRRAVRALSGVKASGIDAEFLTCEGEMGKDELDEVGVPSVVLYEPGHPSTPADTAEAVRRFVAAGAEVLVFAGGDGTARDVFSAAGDRVPMIGIPTGVKMHSAVFLNNVEELAGVLEAYSRSKSAKDAEVMDINEDRFREGTLEAKLFGIARVPDDPARLQSAKTAYHSGSADDEADEIGHYFAETMRKGVIYVLGPGSTTAAIAKNLGIEKTVLGVDVVLDGRVVACDVGEKDLIGLLGGGRDAVVVVTPIGSQGFVFGRGNQQISPKVLRMVGKENITVVATPSKLKDTPNLRVDTGDGDLDRQLKGRIKVITGYKRKRACTVV